MEVGGLRGSSSTGGVGGESPSPVEGRAGGSEVGGSVSTGDEGVLACGAGPRALGYCRVHLFYLLISLLNLIL